MLGFVPSRHVHPYRTPACLTGGGFALAIEYHTDHAAIIAVGLVHQAASVATLMEWPEGHCLEGIISLSRRTSWNGLGA
ncbi:hypothetical protein MES5069_1320007 [Mesorhizobium escarrei]|uniref:Uncharacterized protein n=1 Tax=Mesorhizobium escarrei TaxID=666018 RepID=A0ABN8JFJ0_9HYPH|nr:hypothetical protein MES5069_1320007 [Mesorhizobium escarrei]